MGDRANVHVLSERGGVYLYTHWEGRNLPRILQSALERGRSRWDDASYLARIIFCGMLKDSKEDPLEALKKLTGFGISSTMDDRDNPDLEVNVPEQQIKIEVEVNRESRTILRTFEEFLELDFKDYESPWVTVLANS